MKVRYYTVAALASLAFGSVAQAGTQTGTLNVSMTINGGCTVAGGSVAFGAQTVLGSAVDQTGTFNVTCTNTTPYNIGFDAGANGASVAARRMKGGASNTEFINYSLYTNSGRTANWGNTIGTDTLTGTGNGAAQTVTVYGRVPAQTVGSPGGYSDTVTITVTY